MEDENKYELLSLSKAAKLLRIGRTTLASFIGEGKIKFVLSPTSKRKLVSRIEIENFLRTKAQIESNNNLQVELVSFDPQAIMAEIKNRRQ